jgi:hypothetical protein
MDQAIINPQKTIVTRTHSARKMKMLATNGRQKKASVWSRHLSRKVAFAGARVERFTAVSVVSATGTATLR